MTEGEINVSISAGMCVILTGGAERHTWAMMGEEEEKEEEEEEEEEGQQIKPEPKLKNRKYTFK